MIGWLIGNVYKAAMLIAVECLFSVGIVLALGMYLSKKHGMPLFGCPRLFPQSQKEDRVQYQSTGPKMDAKDVLILVGTILYVISPIDGLPDIFIGVGWLDDAAVIGFAFRHFHNKFWKTEVVSPPERQRRPRAVVDQYEEDDDAIDAEFEVRNLPRKPRYEIDTRLIERRRRR